MATAVQRPEPALGLHGHTVFKGSEAASQAWKQGSPLKVVAGLLTECSNAADVVTNGVGIAMFDATGTTSSEVLYMPFSAACVWEYTVNDASAGGDLAQADFGGLFDYAKAANGYWYFDLDASTSDNGMIVQFQDAVATAFARVLVRIDDARINRI